tara:strand:- start:825 stop:1217 length:393 start_codon:yes stop_codon:yes gene_type:complete
LAANEIKLKRSSVESRVPSVSDLTLGELAVNTYDGKLFFKKNNGSDTLESIVTTNAQITGSVELTGAVTSSLTLIRNQSPSGDVFQINVGGTEKLKVNSDGTLIITPVTTLPTGANGAYAVSGSNFFIYL